MSENNYGSKDISRAAIKLAISGSRDAEKKLCEVKILAAIKETEEVLRFIAETHSSYPWAKIILEELKSNKDLIAFIKENR